jgi:hypothetical protein
MTIDEIKNDLEILKNNKTTQDDRGFIVIGELLLKIHEQNERILQHMNKQDRDKIKEKLKIRHQMKRVK